MHDYGLNIWGNSNFTVDRGKVCINSDYKPALVDIIKEIRSDGIRGPILLRFPHLIKKQIVDIYSNFNRAIKEFEYEG
ncbi:MAG: arginine decarboxylase, partial [Campylobacter sp.]|nr:arginine decarboxylase [Campylobacter sp.]